MKQKTLQIINFIIQPKFFIFLTALFNFIWYFSQSKAVKEFGSTAISFCGTCAWYYYGIYSGLPFILFIAGLCLLVDRWWSYLLSMVISGFQVIVGINWVTDNSGFISGVIRRYELISTNIDSELWQFLDWQYVLALIIFLTALVCLIVNLIKTRTKKILPLASL